MTSSSEGHSQSASGKKTWGTEDLLRLRLLRPVEETGENRRDGRPGETLEGVRAELLVVPPSDVESFAYVRIDDPDYRRKTEKVDDQASREQCRLQHAGQGLLAGQIGSKVRGFWLKSNASLMSFAEASRVLSAFSPKRVSMNFRIEVWSFVWLSTYPLFA